jgi:UDP-glucose 4-epimerase
MVDLLLARGFRVHALDNLVGGREANVARHATNADFALERVDIRGVEPGAAVFAGARFVFHFAGIGDLVPAIEKPAEYLSVNIQGTVAALEAARRAGAAKFVYAASSTCYGLAETPTREDHPIRPEHPYALSKNLGEQAAFHWHRVYGLPVNAIRIFNAYGTRARTSGAYGAVFGVFLRQKLAGKPFTIVGDGTQRRDFVHATDVARAFLAAAETDLAGRAWNVGAGNPQTVNRLAELIGGPRVHIPKRPGEPECTWADISRIRAELGWEPKIRFEDGVAEVVANIEWWRDAPLWNPETIAAATRDWFRYLGPGGAR